ncbi:Rib/alpha-like repeat protein, partial [Corynebacterium glucuronolyticum ATCC 51866]
RRGVSIAAAALSLTLVAPLVQPVALQFAAVAQAQEDQGSSSKEADKYAPQAQDMTVETGQVPNAKDGIKNASELPEGTTFAFQSEVDTTKSGVYPAVVVVTYPDKSTDLVSIKVTVNEFDAIYSPGNPQETGTVNGSVKEMVMATNNYDDLVGTGSPLKGVKIYAQWSEGENTQHTSPIYYTESDENGNFSLLLAPYTDANGVRREFRADASVGVPPISTQSPDYWRDEMREKIRIWTVLPSDLEGKYRLVTQPAVSLYPPINPAQNTTPSSDGNGEWKGNKVNKVKILYADTTNRAQHKPNKDEWRESVKPKLDYGYLTGQAFWNLFTAQGYKNLNFWNYDDGPVDPAAAGLTVVGSYLSDKAVRAIEAYAATNFGGKELRGDGWTPQDEQALQNWIKDQVKKDPTWIAETVKTTTDSNGNFKIFFNGTWGKTYNDLAESDPRFNKQAELNEGTWLKVTDNAKHANWSWSYVSVYGPDGNELPGNIGALYPWVLGDYGGPETAGGSYKTIGGETTKSLPNAGWSAWNIALIPAPLKFKVVEKNTYDNFALPGEKVVTNTSGLPVGAGFEYVIQWVDKDGNEVGKCGPSAVLADTTIKPCPLTVPADAKHGDTFTARLFRGTDTADNKSLLAQDSFAVSRAYFEYGNTEVKANEEKTATPKFDIPSTSEVEKDKPENAVFELGDLPEGVTKEQIKLDPETGSVSFTPTKQQTGKKIAIPVRMVDKERTVPDLDENGNPKVDKDGNALTKPLTLAKSNAVFEVAG